MKNLNWILWGRFTFDDLSDFLQWIDVRHEGRVEVSRAFDERPVDANKVSALIRAIERIEFVSCDEGRLILTELGQRFSKYDSLGKSLWLGNEMKKMEAVRRVIELLKSSVRVRLSKVAVSDSFKEVYGPQMTDSEVMGFIAWGHACGLFRYDPKRAEIFIVERPLPRGSVEA